MTAEQHLTEDQAKALITRLLGTGAQVRMTPFEFGWVTQLVTPQEPTPASRAPRPSTRVGDGCYIVDLTGTVTVHSSLPTPLIAKQYSEARRQGQITGRQVWPQPDQTS